MSRPLVSITSAFYNTEPLLLDMVKSICSQTFTDWELILLDDGSTDDSLKIAKSIDHPDVKVFTNGVNKGRSYSLNRLTELSNGKYIARMDSDDMSCATRIAKQVKLMEAQSDIDVCGTGICYLDRNDNPIGHWIAPVDHAVICRNPSRTVETCHGALLGRTEWFAKLSYNTRIRYAVDFDFLLRASRITKFANIAEPLYFYRLDQSYKFEKQAAARKMSAMFLYKYHKNHSELLSGITHFCKQYLKLGVTALVWPFGLREKLLKRRYAGLNEDEKLYYMNEINKIKSLELPLK